MAELNSKSPEHVEMGGNTLITDKASALIHEPISLDEKVSKKVVRKYDTYMLPYFLLINLCSIIDRVNIGNARLLGLSEDLDLSVGLRWNIALMCLFVTYCVVEFPSNILCKKIGGHIYIPVLITVFGIVTTTTGLVMTRGGLYAVRCLLGIFEGGLSPGLVWMLSQFYRRQELGIRTAIYISAASGSGAFGGLLAIGLSKIPPWGAIHTWKNIFLIEGLMSVLVGIGAFFMIARDPSRAWFLSSHERNTAVDRMRIDSAGTDEHSKTKAKHVWQAVTSVHVLACGAGFFFGNACAQAYSVFSPSIIKALGYTSSQAQLYSVGPYLVAAVFSVFIGYLSDRYKKRAILIMASMPIGILGFAILVGLPAGHTGARYAALYLAATGLYASLPLWLTWAVNNCATPTVRAAAAGIVFTMGSLGGICAPWIYISATPEGYRHGHIVLLTFLCCSWLCAALLRAFCAWDNKEKELGKRDHLLQGLTREQVQELSSKHPAFRYMS